MNEVNCTLFVHDFFSVIRSSQYSFCLSKHVLSVSFSIRWWSCQ